MNAIYVLLSLLSIISFAATTEQVIGGEDICRLHRDGTILLKPGYCDRGIECVESKSVDLASTPCSGTTPHFDPANNKCVVAYQFSVCNPAKNSCALKSPTFINNPYTCDGWMACDGNKLLSSGKCAEYQYFDQSKQSCVYSSTTTCAATYEFCDVTPVNIKFQSPGNCSQYSACEKTLGSVSLKTYTCADGTFFDTTTGACISNALVACNEIPIPYNVCGTVKLAIRGRFVSDRATCRGYFYCKDLGSGVPDPAPSYGQCDENTFFNESWEACLDRAYSKCSWDRCDGRNTGLELSETIGCQHYYECENSITISAEPIKCADNMYFDEYKHECVTAKSAYTACS